MCEDEIRPLYKLLGVEHPAQHSYRLVLSALTPQGLRLPCEEPAKEERSVTILHGAGNGKSLRRKREVLRYDTGQGTVKACEGREKCYDMTRGRER